MFQLRKKVASESVRLLKEAQTPCNLFCLEDTDGISRLQNVLVASLRNLSVIIKHEEKILPLVGYSHCAIII